jgi:predicted P-loop ATPase
MTSQTQIKGVARGVTKPRNVDAGWSDGLLLNGRKQPQPIIANVMIALKHAPQWDGVLGFDSFTHRTVALRPPPWAIGDNAWCPRPWTDRDDILATEWLQHHEIVVGVETTQRGVEAVAMASSFHPVLDYLDGLTWDGRKRLSGWVSRYLGAEPSDYIGAVSRCTLISAIARIKQPGCKVDTVPIIEGPQGIRKSTAIRTLGGQWFTDEISDFGSKDAAMQADGAWFIEIAELDAMSKAETSKVKAFISRTTDRYRPPFGRRVIENKRPSVFWGTTNSETYLKDDTGARRFWPIEAGRIDIDALARDRDQLFAEAATAYRNGEPWWMKGSAVEQDARAEQSDRYVADPWQDPIARYAELHHDLSINEVLANVFGVAVEDMDQRIQNRVSACLRQIDFERYRKRVPGRTSPEWRYRRVGRAE